MGEATDAHRVAKAHTPLEGKLLFREMSGREEISRMFDYRAELLAEEDSGVDPKAVLGQSVTIELEIQGGGSRYIDTQCTRFGYIGHETAGMRKTKFYRYEARLRPWTWYMTLASCCRVFQNQKVPDIVRTVLGAYPYPVDWRLSRGYREWEYCVQYQETDFNFMSRLLEHEGIYYWFEHAMGSHTLVLADDIGAHSSLAGYATIPHLYTDQMVVPDEEWIDHWRMVQEVNSGMFETDDYDLKLPQPHLRVIEMNERPFPNGSYAIYDWPGGYWQTDDGQQYARIRLQELQQPQEIVSAESNARGLTPGYLFNLERCPRRDQDREYLILGVGCYIRDNPYHTGGGAPADWQFTFTAQPSSIPYRPARLTTKPRTMGPQTAVVVGEKGKDEEIVCDEYGRVRVQFHWDHDHSYDEESSCWMRVASGWAGSNWGMISLPRVNQEVIVDFINGDPDYPIIIGRVYNGEHKTPYTLPRWKEYATWKSRSTKHGGNNDWNEIRYYDYKGKEQIYIQAQWRMDMRVKWNKYLTVKEHWHSLIGKGYYLTTGGNYDLHVKGKLYEHVDDEINWSSGAEIKIAGEKDVKISADQSLEGSASMNIVLDAGMELCVKGPGGFISIGPAGVTIQGTMVNINSGGAASSASDFEAEHPYDATECDTGEPGYLDKPPKGGGWAKRGSTKGGPRHGGSGPSPSPGPGPAPAPTPATGYGADIDKLIAKSPTLSAEIKKLKDDGWTFKKGPGGAYFTDKGAKTITIGEDRLKTPESGVQALSHEVGHAMYKGSIDTSSKDAYVKSNLADEGAAAMNNVKVQREIKDNGGPDIGIATSNPANTKKYNDVYDQYLKDGDANKANNAAGDVYGDGETTSIPPHDTYRKYYGDYYDKNIAKKP